jgi:hypothetical protein
MNQTNKLVYGACIEDCIHVAGILNWIQMAEDIGFDSKFSGPATPISTIINYIHEFNPDIVGISYRLTPDKGFEIIQKFIELIRQNNLTNRRFFLGCLPKLSEMIQPVEFFEKIYTGGESIHQLIDDLKSRNPIEKEKIDFPHDLLSRIDFKKPFPILRAHFGLPSLETTIEGIQKISDAKVIDVISIAPDQAAQEWFHHPEIIKTRPNGTGGVEIRTKQDLERLYTASRCGNFPLLRIYSGTQDLVKNAELFHETIHNAWAAIPIFWYSELDGRGPLKLEKAIEEHFDAIKWFVERNIPVEINDPHQWGLRMAPDHLVVAMAYLSARIAKELGVQNYIQQLMFNTPKGTSLKKDFARILAMIDIVKPLISDDFRIIKETRAGLAYFSVNQDAAKGQLITSTLFQMAVKPDIMHIVSYCEGDHAATSVEIIESINLIDKVLQEAMHGLPDFTKDLEVMQRKQSLIEEAEELIMAYELLSRNKTSDSLYLSTHSLANAVTTGLFDAPQLLGSKCGNGNLKTRIINGGCDMVDDKGNIITESQRLINFTLQIVKLIVPNQDS